MSFWWVNHKQTFRHEFFGGYVWCPQVKKNGSRNIFYDFMRLVRPGDLIFSYAGGVIRGAGKAKSHAYGCPRPDEFGHIGEAWDIKGWRVDVQFIEASVPLPPREILDQIAPYIGVRHSPLNANGTGRQSVYFAAIPNELGTFLQNRLGYLQTDSVAAVAEFGFTSDIEVTLPGIDEWESIERRKIETSYLPETMRTALIKARVGQGRFKQNVSRYETQCRVTRVANPVHLIASHIKPWRESNNDERLAAGNGLLLTPSIDHLFDRGFISFDDSGELLVSPVADSSSLRRMGVDSSQPFHVGGFNSDQKHFLQHHRTSVFLADVS
jgi:putative restriction endonuclease